MKRHKLRWNSRKKCWWTYQSNADGVKFIKDYCAKNSEDNSDETVTLIDDKRPLLLCRYNS